MNDKKITSIFKKNFAFIPCQTFSFELLSPQISQAGCLLLAEEHINEDFSKFVSISSCKLLKSSH